MRSGCGRDESGWRGFGRPALDPLVNDETLILTIQNGLGAAERIAKYRAPDNILMVSRRALAPLCAGWSRFTTVCS